MKPETIVQKKLGLLCTDTYGHTIYHNAIPLDEIFKIFKENGMTVVQEDGTPWSGFLCGEDGRATMKVDGTRKHLQIQWHRMPSGHYELNCYLS